MRVVWPTLFCEFLKTDRMEVSIRLASTSVFVMMPDNCIGMFPLTVNGVSTVKTNSGCRHAHIFSPFCIRIACSKDRVFGFQHINSVRSKKKAPKL
jgi:hypothetical protein